MFPFDLQLLLLLKCFFSEKSWNKEHLAVAFENFEKFAGVLQLS